MRTSPYFRQIVWTHCILFQLPRYVKSFHNFRFFFLKNCRAVQKVCHFQRSTAYPDGSRRKPNLGNPKPSHRIPGNRHFVESSVNCPPLIYTHPTKGNSRFLHRAAERAILFSAHFPVVSRRKPAKKAGTKVSSCLSVSL